MADRPAESIKVSCAHCGKTFFVSAKERSSASCPQCDEPLNPQSGIVKRKDRRESAPGLLPSMTASIGSSTLIGAPMTQDEVKKVVNRSEEKSNPKAFKEALAMSRMDVDEMDLEMDDLDPAFFDAPGPFDFDGNEPTIAISLKSDVNDQTKPPPGIVSRPKKKRTKKIPDPSSLPNSEPETVPISAIEEPSEPMTMRSLPHAPETEVQEETRKFRKGMRTSQLSDLLKKAKKEKKGKKTSLPLGVVKPQKTPTPKPAKPQPKARLGAIALNKAPTKPVITVPKSIKAKDKPKPGPSEDSLLIQLQALDKKLASKPGAASENRGSGFIKLPTTDILDVLGKGQFRLRVQDIIYEPVDEKGLTQLIKGGVLLGAEDIAESNGDWMPISEHPVFSGLRERMAKEAHSLLSKVAPGKPEKTPKPIEPKPETKQIEPEPRPIDKPEVMAVTAPMATPIVGDSPKEKPVARPTMQMFAMQRDEPSLITPSLANSIENIDSEAVRNIPEEKNIETEDQTVEKAYTDPSSVAHELTESEFSIVDEPKKKSAMGIFLFVILTAGLLIAGVIYAGSEGYLDSITGNKTVVVEKEEPTKTEEKKEKKVVVVAPDKKEEEKVVAVDPDKKEEEKVVAVDPDKKEEEKVVAVDPDKEKKPDLAIKTQAPIQNLQGATFVNKASGKALALIFEKNGASFLLIPETEKGGLNRIIAAQKLCELLACPFAQNKVKEVTIDATELKATGAPKASSILIVDGKIKALVQPISSGSFSVSTTAIWRPILRASKKARTQELPKSLREKNITLSNPQFARQLGGILLRDFLINDWNRFETKPSHIGVENGRLVDQASIVAFEGRASGRVKGRFGWSSVYPAEMVDKLEKLERKATLEFLFPNASTTDKSRFNVFWKQRSSALERIKTLTAKSGKENVLIIK